MDSYNFENKSILEIGCGISLSSLVLNKRNADISATDYHPESGKFLIENVILNKDKAIKFFLSNWNERNLNLKDFDLIIGSDLLYEDTHSKLLAKFINQHSKQHAEVILVSPVRGYQIDFDEEMKNNNFSHELIAPANLEQLQKPFDGNIHLYKR